METKVACHLSHVLASNIARRIITCLPDVGWTKEIDISQNASRQSIRCVTRDHLPMVGNIPAYRYP